MEQIKVTLREEEPIGVKLENEFMYGLSAYEVAVKNGYVGTEEEWLHSLEGKDGYTPIKGVDYFDGKDGKDGLNGKDGKDGKDYVITPSDYDNIADITKSKIKVPSKTSELTNDTDFTTKSYVDEQVSKGGKVTDVKVNGTSVLSNGVANVPVPTKTSELTNDSGFLTEHQSLDGYVTENDIASNTKRGVIKMDANLGSSTGSSGNLRSITYDKETFSTKSDYSFVSKGTLFNVLDDYATKEDIPSTDDFVKNTDYASGSKGGVFLSSGSYGVVVSNNGYLQSNIKSISQYETMSNIGFISKGTLENVLSAKGYITSDDIDNRIVVVEFADLTSELIENCYENNIALVVKRDGWIYRLSGGNSNDTPTLYFQSLSSTTNRYFTYYYGDKKISKVGTISIPTTQAINQLIDAKLLEVENGTY